MKNANLPASPTPYMDISVDGGWLHCDEVGLTKREMFAMHIMASTCWNATDGNQPYHYKSAAESAVKLADALLLELGR